MGHHPCQPAQLDGHRCVGLIAIQAFHSKQMWSRGKGTEEQVQLSMGVNHTFEADDTLRNP